MAEPVSTVGATAKRSFQSSFQVVELKRLRPWTRRRSRLAHALRYSGGPPVNRLKLSAAGENHPRLVGVWWQARSVGIPDALRRGERMRVNACKDGIRVSREPSRQPPLRRVGSEAGELLLWRWLHPAELGSQRPPRWRLQLQHRSPGQRDPGHRYRGPLQLQRFWRQGIDAQRR